MAEPPPTPGDGSNVIPVTQASGVEGDARVEVGDLHCDRVNLAEQPFAHRAGLVDDTSESLDATAQDIR
jgi:hypothetical protein